MMAWGLTDGFRGAFFYNLKERGEESGEKKKNCDTL